MKLCTFEVQKEAQPRPRVGCVHKGGIVDLQMSASMLELIQGGKPALEAAMEAFEKFKVKKSLPYYELTEVRLKAPLDSAPMLRDFSAFDTHAKRMAERRGGQLSEAWYKHPLYYKGNPTRLLGPDDEIIWPSYTKKLDYELELAFIIGEECRNVSEDQALNYVFGYTILNDFSARDIQMEEMALRLGPAKGKDFGNSIGPWIVTADEIPDPHNLKMIARVNGEVWSEGNTKTSYWSFSKLIAYASLEETLLPGEIIGTGTVGGGCGMELDRWVQPGDLVELEIEKIGILKNRIGSP